ncbi:MAG: hypothetical protein U9Q35_03120 [Pseudomonadota bacterium]|nr:hypothetical protein [Pseudomonadota bacterium]
MVFDIGMRSALRHLVNGNGDPLADLIEKGQTQNLHKTLEHYPEARGKLAKAIRTGKPLNRREHPYEKERIAQRNWYLFGRIAYWIGSGFDDKWQESKENTVWHLAIRDWPVEPREGFPDVNRLESADRLRKLWSQAIKNKDAYTFMNLEREFLNGVEEALGDQEKPYQFAMCQLSKANQLGLNMSMCFSSIMSMNDLFPDEDAE